MKEQKDSIRENEKNLDLCCKTSSFKNDRFGAVLIRWHFKYFARWFTSWGKKQHCIWEFKNIFHGISLIFSNCPNRKSFLKLIMVQDCGFITFFWLYVVRKIHKYFYFGMLLFCLQLETTLFIATILFLDYLLT